MSAAPPTPPPRAPAPARRLPRPLGAALALVLLASLPASLAQLAEFEEASARGKPFWMQPAYAELGARLAAGGTPHPPVVLWSDHPAKDHRLRVFGLQFHAVPRAVLDVRDEARARAALAAGHPLLVDLVGAGVTADAVARLRAAAAEHDHALELIAPAAGEARLLVPAGAP